MGEAEKISSLLAISAFLMWPILFSGSSLFFSERQKDQLSELGKVKASLWRLGKISNFLTNFFGQKFTLDLDRDSELIENSFDGIRKRHAYIRNHMKNNTGQIRGMKEASRSKFIRLKGLLLGPARRLRGFSI